MDRSWLESTRALVAEDMKRRFEIWPGTAPGKPDLNAVSSALHDMLPTKVYREIWNRVVEWDHRMQPCELTDDIFTYLIVDEARRLEDAKSFRDSGIAEIQGELASRQEDEAIRFWGRLLTGIDEFCSLGGTCTSRRNVSPERTARASDMTNRPAWLVEQLESTAPGCKLLFEEWREAREILRESNPWWFHVSSFWLIGLLGKEPRDALADATVIDIFLASHAIDRDGKNPFTLLRGSVSLEEVKEVLLRIGPRLSSSVDESDREQGRQTLLAIVDQQITRLRARFKDHRRRSRSEDARIEFARAFDESPRSKQIERFKRDVKERVLITIDSMRRYEAPK